MKKIFFVLLIAGIAISANAFSKKIDNALGRGVVYYQDQNNIWKPLQGQPPIDFCTMPDSDPCTFLFFDNSILYDYPDFFTQSDVSHEHLLETYDGIALNSRARSRY